jgi:hypothetical protein
MSGRIPALCVAGALLTVSAPLAASSRVAARGIRNGIEEHSTDCRLKRVESHRLGRFRLWAVRRIAGIARDVSPEVHDMLRSLRRVEVVTFSASGDGCQLPIELAEAFDTPAWSRVMREAEDDSASLIYQHQDDGGDLDGLVVVELDGHDLEIVSLEGHVEAFLAAAIAGEDLSLHPDTR